MTPPPAYRPIARKIDSVRRAEERSQLLVGGFNALAGLLAIVTTVTLLEHFFRFDATGRTILFWSGSLLALLVLGRSLAEPLGRIIRLLPRQSEEMIAGRVGATLPEVGDRLLNVVQLHRQIVAGGSAGVSVELAGASIVRSAESLVAHDFGAIIDPGERRRSLLLLLSSLLLTLSGGLTLGGSMTEAIGRVIDHRAHYQAPAPFTLHLQPGDVEIGYGDAVEVSVRVEGVPPVELTLVTEGVASGRTERMEFEEIEVGRYVARIGNVQESLRYHAEGAGVSTPDYTIAVVERPAITNVEVRLIPPAYSRLERQTLSSGEGHATGLRGTQASITAETTLPVASAEIVQILPLPLLPGGLSRVDTLRLPMSVNGTRISGGFPLLRNGEYHIEATTTDGAVARSASWAMSVTPDLPPSIRLLQPKLGLDVDESHLIPVQVAINDDFGFSHLRIRYRLVESRYNDPWSEPKSESIGIPSYARNNVEVPYLWDLAAERFMPEDKVEAWVEVADNDPFLGPKWAKTTRFLLRYPSFDEILVESEAERGEATDRLRSVMREAEEARRDMERMNRELARQLNARGKEASQSQKREMREMIRRHEEMQQQVAEVADNLREVAEVMKKMEAISPETLREYEELQKLFESIDSPQLRSAMKRLQKEMERMSPEETIEAMKELEFSEEEFRKSLERARERLEKMKSAEDIARLAERAERLAEEQRALDRDPSEAEQRDLAEKTDALQRDAAALQRESAREAAGEKGNQEKRELSAALNRAGEELARRQPAEGMRRAAREIAAGRPEEGRRQGEKSAEALEKFSSEMEQLAEQLSRNRNAERAERMKKSLKELLDMAKKQEELQKKTVATPSGSEEMRGQARQQADLKRQLENLANETGSPEKPSFVMTPQMAKELGDALSRMKEAQSRLEGRDAKEAARSQGEAVSAMTRAAGEMAGQLERQGEGEGGEGGEGGQGGSTRSQIRKLAAEQQALASALRKQGGGSEGEGESGSSAGSGRSDGSEEGQGGAGRLARRQGEIGKSIAELAREARESSTGGRRASLAEQLEEAARQIEEVVSDMADGTISPETEQRQDRILSRLLDALRSDREREYDESRESTPGRDRTLASPVGPDGNPTGTEQNPQAPGVERVQGYAPEYRDLILRYLNSLE